MKSELKPRKLKELADAYLSQELRVNREYQRGTKWSQSQKQVLIDSLLRGYRIPLFYVHLKETPNFADGVNTTAFLVDGQQRLAAITDYLRNEFSLPKPEEEARVNPTLILAQAPWRGKTFEQLEKDERDNLLSRELLVVEVHGSENEVRDLFIRLQAGTPLTAQEKRDAWPGNFTTFVIRHAGKPEHPASNPKPFFQLVPRGKTMNIDDGGHYVDGLAERRKFLAGLAMTIILRARSDMDFVDLKGRTINEFYMGNLDLKDDDAGATRVIKALDTVVALPGFEKLLARRPMSHQMAFDFRRLRSRLAQPNRASLYSVPRGSSERSPTTQENTPSDPTLRAVCCTAGRLRLRYSRRHQASSCFLPGKDVSFRKTPATRRETSLRRSRQRVDLDSRQADVPMLRDSDRLPRRHRPSRH